MQLRLVYHEEDDKIMTITQIDSWKDYLELVREVALLNS